MKNVTISSTGPGRRRVCSFLKGALALLFWLALWQLAALKVGNTLLVPSPLTVGARLAELLPTAAFWRIIGHSLIRIMLGFGLGVAGGAGLALLTHVSRLADLLISPALKAVLATPVASFIILMIIWFKAGQVPMLIALLVVLPVMWSNIRAGIRATDAQLLEMARLFRLSRWRKLSRLYVPSLKPHFLSACTIALGLAWKSGVAAEVISYTRFSIGGELKAGQTYLQTADVFVWTITVIVLSLLMGRLLAALFKRLEG